MQINSHTQAPSFKEGRTLWFVTSSWSIRLEAGIFEIWHGHWKTGQLCCANGSKWQLSDWLPWKISNFILWPHVDLINQVKFWSLLYSFQTWRLDSSILRLSPVKLTNIAGLSNGSPAQYKNNGEVPIHFSTISVFYITQTINTYHHYAFLTHSRPFYSLRVSCLCSHHPWWQLRRKEGRRGYHQDKSWTGLRAVSILND